jgi:hypothetical protein
MGLSFQETVVGTIKMQWRRTGVNDGIAIAVRIVPCEAQLLSAGRTRHRSGRALGLAGAVSGTGLPVRSVVGHSVTVQVHNKDVFAEIALGVGSVHGEDFWHVGCAIAQIVSDSGVEELNRQFAFRRNVTSVTFKVEGFQSQSLARWSLSFWS